MKKTRLIVFMLLGLVGAAHSQTIKGKVVDLVDNKPLSGATLTLTSVKDTLKKFNTLADANGAFEFTGVSKDSFFFKMTFREYEDYRQIVALNDSIPSADLGTLFIPKKTTTLNDVVVTAKVPPVQQKGDTAQYNASQFKVNPDATVEDLVKKMPGITVDRSGTVTAQGQQVQKVTLDGRDFFGDDATAALRNLPADVVDKIQVFDRMSDQAQFTGFDDGSGQRSINIITKSGVTNGQFGRIYAGYGTDSRYAAGGNVSFFKGNKRISFVGNFNNINQQNFASQDILGAMTGGGGGGARGGGGGNFGGGGGNFGGGGGNFGGGGFGGGFGGGQQSGISKTNGLGINFGDKWGKKLDVQGSYFFNNSNNLNDNVSSSLTPFPGSTLQQNSTSLSRTKNTNHRINMRLTYTIDDKNSIIFTPNVSFQNTNSNSESMSATLRGLDSTNYSNGNTRSVRDGYNIRNNVLWRHAFAKRGRTLTVNLTTSMNKNNSEAYNYNYIRYYDKGVNNDDSTQNQFRDNVTDGYTLSANVSYTEPIGKNSQLQFSYQPSYTKNNADQMTYDYDTLTKGYNTFKQKLSNKFDNTTTAQSGGVTYRLGASRDNQFSVGFNIQFTDLTSSRSFPGVSEFSQKFTNVLPNLMWRKKISPKSSFQLFYRANTQTPSVTQLQDVLNNQNPINVSIGNPQLKQSFTQLFTGRYTFTNTQKGQSFFANLSGQFADNYIANATYIIGKDTLIQAQSDTVKKNSNFSKPMNFSGYKSFSSFFTFSQPVKFIKSNVSLTAGVNYSTIPGLRVDTLGIETHITTKNLGYSTGAVVASNINEYIDFNLSYNANFSNVKSNIAKTNHSVTQSAGAQINLLTKTGWFLQNDVTYQSTSGLTQGNNIAYALWNAAVGKKVFKKKQAEIKLSVFDLLKQNQAITRTINQQTGAIEDSRSRVLTQYFMLTFTYSLKSFGTPARNNNRGNFEGRGNFGPGGFGGQGGGMPGGFGGGRPNF